MFTNTELKNTIDTSVVRVHCRSCSIFDTRHVTIANTNPMISIIICVVTTEGRVTTVKTYLRSSVTQTFNNCQLTCYGSCKTFELFTVSVVSFFHVDGIETLNIVI